MANGAERTGHVGRAAMRVGGAPRARPRRKGTKGPRRDVAARVQDSASGVPSALLLLLLQIAMMGATAGVGEVLVLLSALPKVMVILCRLANRGAAANPLGGRRTASIKCRAHLGSAAARAANVDGGSGVAIDRKAAHAATHVASSGGDGGEAKAAAGAAAAVAPGAAATGAEPWAGWWRPNPEVAPTA